ncbi:MAG: Ig-like domain-containing protein [Candidatus Cryptobacteroides sp.]|nr:Ig-like domain-containing protein [Candidatus Cryptobacteroides sp.]
MKRISILLSLMVGFILTCSCVSQEDIEKLQNQIDQQNSRIQTSIAELENTDKALNVYIEDLTKTAESLQKSISQTDAKLEAAKQEFDKALNDTAAEVLAQLTAARTELQNQIDRINATIEILKARDTELEEKIDDLRDSTFVTTDQYNSVLGTISSIQQTIEGLNKSVTAAEKRIEEVAASLEPLKNEIISEITSSITADYKNAIATAKAETEAAYTKAIADAIAALESSLKTWVNEQISAILSRIQSVSYVPRYSDGKASMSYYIDNGTFMPRVGFFDFEIHPSSAAAELAKVWQSSISMSAVYTVTRTAPEFVPLTIESVTEDNGFLTVTVSGSNLSEDFFSNSCSANARMKISDGNNELASDYIQVVPWAIPISITLDKKSVYLSPEETVKLNTTVDVDPVYLPYLPIVWSSSDPSVATVSNGVVSAKKKGYATITAKIGGEKATCLIAVDAPLDLSAEGTANCYHVSRTGQYRFKAVKGNTETTVGDVNTVEVLWESFGTGVMPNVGDLIYTVSFIDGYVHFSTPETFANGNAVIAVKDANGDILWSWHIWCSEEGWQEHIYDNNAGTMMDRNLGATSATPGSVGALGLLYQWGRKDPFLGSSSISSPVQAISTGNWEVSSTQITNELAISNPTTFFTGWENYLPDANWQSKKTVYDPCPAGWRVPDGGTGGIWKNAGFANTSFDSANRGISFSISSPETTWYPASGYLNYGDGVLGRSGLYGYYWSVTPDSRDSACNLVFNFGGVNPASGSYRSSGFSVRCLQE